MKVEVDPGSVTGTPQELRCGRVLISDSKSFHFSESKRAFLGPNRRDSRIDN